MKITKNEMEERITEREKKRRRKKKKKRKRGKKEKEKGKTKRKMFNIQYLPCGVEIDNDVKEGPRVGDVSFPGRTRTNLTV